MKVSVICVSDRPERLPLLAWCLTAQTHKDWELIILDQSEAGDVARHIEPWMALERQARRIDVMRVPYVGDWGQTVKEKAARVWADGDALMFPADDAYYTPPALGMFVGALEHGCDLSVCGWVYDLIGYFPASPSLEVGRVDVGGFAVRREWFDKVGWADKSQTGDGQLITALVNAGARVAMIPNVLYVKN